jgi:alpha-galactosidase
MPTRVFVQHEDELLKAPLQGKRFTTDRASVELDGADVRVYCPTGGIARVVLRWEFQWPQGARFLGDHWERSYGDLAWRIMEPARVMPWYFAASAGGDSPLFMLGVATQPAALCFWTADDAGASLWLDLRNGGSPCIPGDREIKAATIISFVSGEGDTPAAALRKFCKMMCAKPRLPAGPLCGNNNWYYAYGQNFDAQAMRRDAQFLAEISEGQAVRPYCVIDAGWTPGSSCPGGPWLQGDAKRFPDMPGLAADMKRLGVRPGIWMRPTALTVVDKKSRLRAGPVRSDEKPLDLTQQENLEGVRADVARVRSWGFELIKHDFSTFDAFGRWGFEMGAEITDDGWHFSDQSLTNAEILLNLYRMIRNGAGDAVVIGCNTIGHLGAGLFEAQRIGDDTSGLMWERTRRMGVNSLAYRIAQNGTFFVADADCAAHTEKTPWDLDRQYLDLIARSGTALFVSVNPETISADKKAAFRSAMQTALGRSRPADCEPVGWMDTSAPSQWRMDGQSINYAWEQPWGSWPFRV